ncbi:acyl-CoA synthetase [Rhodococcus opacus]|uniref:acyl-CoA synthetase n=1 Tax=Rhodococcus opacus TaxID=37919 RepID=UPI0024752E9A|nr:acyl-CoA synthetase [Rhodococcus opacus]MDH6291992.1 long-chain acyl-CoA synthetase [Rhodococcus opacus]
MYPGTFALTTPDKPAIVLTDTGAMLTYAQLDERSIRLANRFREAGLRPGDDVAVLLDNGLEYYVVYWAALRSGLYVTALNHHLKSSEIAYIIGDCGAKVLVVSASMCAPAVELIDQTPGVVLRLAVGGPVEGHDDYDAALAASSPTPPVDQPRGADLLYSSGTTGRPKGIKPALSGEQINTHVNVLQSVFGRAYGLDGNTVYLSPAPLYHSAPLRFGGMVHEVGGTVVIMPNFDPEAALEALEQYRVTHSQWVPTMFVRMLKLDEEKRLAHDLSSHRVAVHAAAPCPVEVKQKMIDWWGPILEEYYAATEALGVTMIDSETWLRKPGSVGRTVLGTVHICDDEGDVLPVGDVGLVYFERDVFPFTYHNDPEKTRATQHPQHTNWGTTGDLGYVDSDGYLFLTDRKAFMIISGGVNIYPQEIESELTLHPAVFDLAVFGVPHPEMGEQVKAVVQPMSGVESGPDLEAELIGFLRERIAHYKIPRSIDFVSEVPRTATGKLQKYKLQSPAGTSAQ